MRWIFIVFASATGLATLPCPATAGEKPSTKAVEHHKAAERAFQAGRYEEAASEFLAAHKKQPRPIFLFLAADAYERAEKDALAASHYRKYLQATKPKSDEAAKGEATDRDRAKGTGEGETKGESGTGESGTEGKGSAKRDGKAGGGGSGKGTAGEGTERYRKLAAKRLAKLEAERAKEAGDARETKGSDEAGETKGSDEAGETTLSPPPAPPKKKAGLDTDEDRAKEGARQAAGAKARPGSSPPKEATEPAPAEKKRSHEERSRLSLSAWALVGVSAVLLTVTGVFALKVEDAEDNMRRLAVTVDPTDDLRLPYEGSYARDYEDYRQEGKLYEKLSWAFAGLSAAAVVGSAVLFTLDYVMKGEEEREVREKRGEKTGLEIMPVVSPSSAGLVVGTRF
jgi:hypothetical protein